MMNAQDVVGFYRTLSKAGVEIWIDGGWAVDALLGHQTRPHKDLDIAVQQKHVSTLRELLEARGYKDVPRDDTSPWNFVLGDAKSHAIDVHVIVLDAEGNGIYGPQENGEMYPASSLTGEGAIDGQRVKCISAKDMVKFISPWLHKRRAYDFKSVSALCEKFGIPFPAEYDQYKPKP